MISQLSRWTELCSGLNLSCAIKEQSTWDQLLTISPGTSTTPWMFWPSCSPVQPLLSSFFSSAANVAVEDVAGLQRGRKNRHLVPSSSFLLLGWLNKAFMHILWWRSLLGYALSWAYHECITTKLLWGRAACLTSNFLLVSIKLTYSCFIPWDHVSWSHMVPAMAIAALSFQTFQIFWRIS